MVNDGGVAAALGLGPLAGVVDDIGVEQRHIIQLFSHAHERLAEFAVEVVGGPNNGKIIYWTNDWQHPPILNFDPPLTLKAGEGLKAIATYNNSTSNTIRFGLQSTDEMMIVFGAYYKGELLSSVSEDHAPTTFSLEQNYPNPFNPSTTIHFELPAAGFVALKVYDMLGKETATLANSYYASGSHSVIFNGSNAASGMYFYRLMTGGGNEVKKMMLVR